MKQKFVIVGGVAGGASTAARLRRMNETAEIVLFEKGPYISFANCGLPYYIGGTIQKRSALLLQTPEAMKARFNIDVRVMQEVIAINRTEKTVTIKHHTTGEVYETAYDVLVLSPGSSPLKPPIPGIDHENVMSLWNVPDTDHIKAYIQEHDIKKATVIGGGFIGIEMAENLHEIGIEVAIAEMAPQVMAPIDLDLVQYVHAHLKEKGVGLYLDNGVKSFRHEDQTSYVVLSDGTEVESDLIILAIGIKPNGELAVQSGLEVNKRGGIVVSDQLQTSDPNIYALGDVIEVADYQDGEKIMVPLAGPANKQGRILANVLSGVEDHYVGTQGTSIAKIFDLTVAATGWNEKQLAQKGLIYGQDYYVSIVLPNHHVTYYPGYQSMAIKLIFDAKGKVLGAQAVGREGVDKRIDVIATAIHFKGHVQDLTRLELAYAPPYGAAKDAVNMAAFVAENILKGIMTPIRPEAIKDLDLEGVQLIDVRTHSEFKRGHIEGATWMDVNTIREQIKKIDEKRPVVIYCAVGVRGHVASRILKAHGYNVKNLLGGYDFYQVVSGN